MGDLAAITQKMSEGCPAMRARQAGRTLARLYNKAFRELGLELSQLPVLAVVASSGDVGVGVSELAELTVMERTTVTRAIRPLEKKGLLRVARSPDDARSKIVVITRAGERMVHAAYPLWERTTRRIREVFGAGRIDALNVELSELMASARNITRRES